MNRGQGNHRNRNKKNGSTYHHKLACIYQPNEIQSLSCNTPSLLVLVPAIFTEEFKFYLVLKVPGYILTKGGKTDSQ